MPSSKRIAERYVATKIASGGYGPHFMSIVKCVDAFDKGRKLVVKAQTALDAMGKLIEKDPDITEGKKIDGVTNAQYGARQQLEYLEKALQEANKAVEGLSEQYDQSNAAFLRMGLK